MAKILNNSVIRFILKYKIRLLFLFILSLHIFFRFSHLLERANFGWDQIDSAWAAKSIIRDKHFLLNGPVAKGNSGIYMGPLYYFFIAVFYFFTNLDPVASPMSQAVLSVVNFLVLFLVTKKIFNTKIALVAIFINTFSATVMGADRTQSAFYLIVPISFLIFYSLYQIISGKPKQIIWLAVFTGLSFHFDFTSIFYPFLILLSLPFFPRTKKTVGYLLLSIPIFLLLISPILINIFAKSGNGSGNYIYLFQTFYHGLHLTRVLQLSHDAFISFEQILQMGFFRPLVFFVLLVFMVIFYKTKPEKQSLKLFYLMSIWVVVPWLILSTYAGELTDYYFSLSRDLVIAILAFLTVFFWEKKLFVFKMILIIFWAFYCLNSWQYFESRPDGNLLGIENSVRQTIKEKKIIPYKDHDPSAYIYEIYTKK